jgi:hypothetical protein
MSFCAPALPTVTLRKRSQLTRGRCHRPLRLERDRLSHSIAGSGHAYHRYVCFIDPFYSSHNEGKRFLFRGRSGFANATEQGRPNDQRRLARKASDQPLAHDVVVIVRTQGAAQLSGVERQYGLSQGPRTSCGDSRHCVHWQQLALLLSEKCQSQLSHVLVHECGIAHCRIVYDEAYSEHAKYRSNSLSIANGRMERMDAMGLHHGTFPLLLFVFVNSIVC